MAVDADQVRVASAGTVYLADEGTALPTDVVTAMTGSWVDIGYVTTDGVEFTFSRETEDLDAWQGTKIRVLTLREPKSLSFALMETSRDVLYTAFGGGSVSGTGDSIVYTPPAAGSNSVRALVVEFEDDGDKYRYCVPRVQVEGDVVITLQGEDALTYPLELGVLDATPDNWKIITNDTAFESGTLTP